MSGFPQHVRVSYRESKRAGLVAAVSEDLPGLMTVAESMEEVDRRIPSAIAQIIEAQYGVRVHVVLRDADESSDGFTPIGERTMELHAA